MTTEGVFNRMISTRQAASILNCSPAYVCALIKKGELHGARQAAPDGCPGKPGWAIPIMSVYDYKKRKEEAKKTPKDKRTHKMIVDEDTKALLTELHGLMARQTEIIGLLIEKMT